MEACKGSEAVTRGVRVAVRPFYIPEQSRPDLGEYVFGYRISIANEGDERVKLISRKWVIVDADGDVREVEGEGVVGQQPEILPGGVHEYSSFCSLETPWGTMEGHYVMKMVSGETFEAAIGRFYLVGG